jgi:hypothetical protein
MLNFRLDLGEMLKGLFTKGQTVEPVAAPANFANASPFRRQKEQNDPIRNGIFIGLGIVLLMFFGSMIAVLLMHAPPL